MAAMTDRDEQQVTEDEARVARLRLEAIREEMARRPVAQPREESRTARAAGASFKVGTLVLFVVVILVGLYVLKLASKALQLG